MKTKTCTKCKEEKSIDDFYKHPSTPDKLDYRCKSCKYKEERQALKSKEYCIVLNRYIDKQYRYILYHFGKAICHCPNQQSAHRAIARHKRKMIEDEQELKHIQELETADYWDTM